MIKLNIFHADAARGAVQNPDPDVGVTVREQVGNFFRPFNKAVGITIKILLVAHIQCFRLIFKTIEIKMKNPAVVAGVFVYDRKRRTGSLLGYAKLFA